MREVCVIRFFLITHTFCGVHAPTKSGWDVLHGKQYVRLWSSVECTEQYQNIWNNENMIIYNTCNTVIVEFLDRIKYEGEESKNARIIFRTLFIPY